MRVFQAKSLLALAAALMLACVLPMNGPAQAAPAVAAPAHDPVKIAVAVQILDNLQTLPIAIQASRHSLLSDPTVTAMSPADQVLLGQLLSDELTKRHDEMMTGLAADNVDRFSLDQLNNILIFSRIKYVQQLARAAADSSLPTPDPTTMSEQEWKDFNTIGNADYTADFLNNFNFAAESHVVGEAVTAAVLRLATIRSGKP